MDTTESHQPVIRVNIEDEMKQSYMDYAMSVIVGRALPDVRDGLKPVHRRVLYAMHEMGVVWNKPYKKSARIVGDVMGKYHPHGDSAIYDTVVRMAQSFSLRYELIDGQGNFGSIDGDAAAAMRYTEIRMSRIAGELLVDIDKETVDFVPNYDGAESEPSVLPTRIPNLLVNGTSGIAVGMATNIPSHNLGEIINACLALIDNSELDADALMEYVPGPDFATAGIINGTAGIREAYATGRGRIHIRAKTSIESDASGYSTIIIKELPYQVNKARLLEKIAELVKEKKIAGIKELRDESDKDGMRVVIDLRRGEVAEVLLNNLYKQTQLQTVFGINMVALVDNRPQLINLPTMLNAFISHRREVVVRRSLFELRKARARAHILEGLAVALANIEMMIELIKQAPDPATAKQALLTRRWSSGTIIEMSQHSDAQLSRPDNLPAQYGLDDDGYQLSPAQAQAILELRLQKLTGLEQEKILQEYAQLLETIRGLLDILSQPPRLMQVIKDELAAIKEQFADPRRTRIILEHQDLSTEDLIPETDVIVTLSHAGYAKSQVIDTYRTQRRGGKGKSSAKVKEDDFIDKMFVASTHDTLLCFSSLGQVYWLKVYTIPQAGRAAKGKPIVNLLSLRESERITAVLPVREFSSTQFVFMATADGTVKKTPLEAFSRPRTNGVRAIDLQAENQLIGVELTDGQHDVMLFSNTGKAVRFHESKVRPTGRIAKGMRGMRLKDAQHVISLIAISPEASGTILTATENGFGKCTPVSDYPSKNRGGIGVISIKHSQRNGAVVGAICVDASHEIMLISDQGTLMRTRVADISIISRNTYGVRLVNLSDGEKLVSIEQLIEVQEEPDLEDSE